jgi:hypothetical protein
MNKQLAYAIPFLAFNLGMLIYTIWIELAGPSPLGSFP